MESTTFSIIIPTYNAEKTLYECLESINQQVFDDYEVLIIDAVSTDSTLDICRSFNNKRFKLHSSPDSGIYDAMNKGIALAKGRWLYFLGSDDKLYDKEVLSQIALTTQNPKAKLIYGNVFVNDTKTVYCGKVDDVEILYQNICHQAIFYNYIVFRDQLFDTQFKVCADHDFNLKIFQHFYEDIHYTDVIVANYSNTGFSSTTTDDFAKKLPDTRIDFLKTKGWFFKAKYRIYTMQLRLKPSPLRGIIYRFFKSLS